MTTADSVPIAIYVYQVMGLRRLVGFKSGLCVSWLRAMHTRGEGAGKTEGKHSLICILLVLPAVVLYSLRQSENRATSREERG